MPRSQPKNRRKRAPHAQWKTVAVKWKKDIGDNMLVGYASMWGFPADEHGDVVRRGAFRKTILEKVNKHGIPLLDSHIYDAAHTIGTVVKAEEDEIGLKIWAKLSTSPTALDIKQKLIEGHIGKLSIGYDVVKESYGRDPQTKKPVRFLNELKLFEISVVPIPASDRTKIMQVKSVVPFQDLPLAGRNDSWDSDAALARVRDWAGGGMNLADMNWTRYRRAFLWYDRNSPQEVGSYKLPIADVMDGRLTAVPRGIFAAAAAVQGARGGVDIPPNDLAGVRSQLDRYYSKMRDEFDDDNLTPPWQTSAKGAKKMEIKQLSIEGMTDEEVMTAYSTLADLYIMFQDDESRMHVAEMAAPFFMALVDAGETLDDELGMFLMQFMEEGDPMDNGAETDDDMDEQLRMEEEEELQGMSKGRLQAQGKAGNRHNKRDREAIKHAIENLLKLMSEDEKKAILDELADDSKGNNKPNAAQPYNRDDDYEAKPNHKGLLTSKADEQKRRLQQLKLKQFQL